MKRKSTFSRILPVLLIVLTPVIFTGCLEEDAPPEVEPLEYSSYSGYWKVDLNAASNGRIAKTAATEVTSAVFPIDSEAGEQREDSRTNSSYQLEFHKLSSWSNYITVSNSGSAASDIAFGDEVYINFAVANTGSEIFSVYLNASREAEVTIKWDDVVYDNYLIIQLQANYYEAVTIPLDNFYGDLDFSPGRHEIELILDVPGQSSQTISRTITIEAPDIMADSFEFTENMYFIEDDGQIKYGNVSFNGSKLVLHGYGDLEIVEDSDDMLIVEMSLSDLNGRKLDAGYQFGLKKQEPSIDDTKMTNLLCHDPWELVETSSNNTPVGQKWMFHRSGHYDFINTNAGLTRKAWGYDSETSIRYGFEKSQLNGRTEIVELTQDRMVMDDSFNTFTFARK